MTAVRGEQRRWRARRCAPRKSRVDTGGPAWEERGVPSVRCVGSDDRPRSAPVTRPPRRGALGARAAVAAALLLALRAIASAPEGARAAPGPKHRSPSPAAQRPHHPFSDAAYWVRILEDPGRAEWQRPAAVVETLALRPGMVVADIGAGTGYFSRRLARAVAPGGRVLAVDIEPALLAELRRRAAAAGINNIATVLAEPADPRLAPASLDLVFIADTWHHISRRVAYARRLRAALRPGGRLVIVDWAARETPIGPPRAMRVSAEQVVRELKEAGFRLLARPPLLPYQYLLVFGR